MPWTRWLAAAVVLAAACCWGCGREILPEEYYKYKSQEERERAREQAEREAYEAAPQIPVIGPMRTWTTPSGDSSVEGALIKVEGDRVWIRVKNGTSAGIPMARLSEADQQYAKETAAKFGRAR